MQMEVFATARKPGWIALRSQLPLVDEESPRAWVQLAYEGEWEGHHQGPFALKHEDFVAICHNFDRQANAVPLTYEHPQYTGDGQPIPAAGWIHKLALRGQELWGLIEFTPRASKMVKDGEYRFCSVVVNFGAKDRRTNSEISAELIEVGLTNVPFLDGLEPIRLSRRIAAAATKEIAMSDVDMIKAALKKLGDEASLDAVVKWVEAQKAVLAVESGEPEAAEEPAELPPAAASAPPSADSVQLAGLPVEAAIPSTDETVEPAAVDFEAVLGAIAEAAGMDTVALVALLQEQVDAVGAYLKQLAEGAPSGTAAEAPVADQAAMSRKLSVADTTINMLQKQVSELMAEKSQRDKEAETQRALARRAEAERVIDAAITAGKALDAERDDLIALHLEDEDRSTRMLSARGQVVPVGQAVRPKPPEAKTLSLADVRRSAEYQKYERSLKRLIPNRAQRHEKILERLRAQNIDVGRA